MRALGASRTSLVPGGVLAGPWVKNDLWRKARAVPSLDLRFADNKSLTDAVTGASLVTFTRASNGTYTDSAGVLQTATTDAPRFDHSITSSTTNLVLRSEEFDTVNWTKLGSTVTPNATSSPTGATTADKLVESATNAEHLGRQIVSGYSAGAAVSCSIFVKAAERTSLKIRVLDTVVNANGFEGAINTAGGTTAGSSSGTGTLTSVTATNVGNSWWKIVVVGVVSSTSISCLFDVFVLSGNASSSTVYAGNGTSGIYLWGAQLEQSATVGPYVPTTTAAATSNTTESLGLLVEEQRTNSVANNTMVGAVAGTPGTIPTGWIYATDSSNGLTLSIVGTGVENGINYIDFRFNGTTVASPATCAIGIVNATAATGQTWTASTYWKLAAGTATGITGWQIGIIESTAGGSFVTGAFYAQTAPTSAALITQRPAATRTLSGGATIGLVTYPINVSVAGNTAIDFTIRIGLPQLEQGAFATSPILTSTAAATRNADVASITGSAFSGWYRQDEGTVFAEGRAVNNGVIAVANDGSFDNRKPQLNLGAIGSVDANYVAAGSLVASFTQVSSVGISNRWATAYAVDNFGFSSNGLAPAQDSSGALPSGINALRLGSFQNGSSYANGPIKRLCFWPARLPNSTLQALTQ